MITRTYVFNVNPHTKPRMTTRDKWKGRTCVKSYYSFKDLLKLEANRLRFKRIEASIKSLIFYIPMPESWSKKKKQMMFNSPHQFKPDLDNLVKALQDALLQQDNYIYKIECLAKYWAYEGSIVLIQNEEE